MEDDDDDDPDGRTSSSSSSSLTPRFLSSLRPQKATEEHAVAQEAQIRSLFKFCQGAAHVWDCHELGLAKQERALQAKLDECRQQHDTENQVTGSQVHAG